MHGVKDDNVHQLHEGVVKCAQLKKYWVQSIVKGGPFKPELSAMWGLGKCLTARTPQREGNLGERSSVVETCLYLELHQLRKIIIKGNTDRNDLLCMKIISGNDVDGMSSDILL